MTNKNIFDHDYCDETKQKLRELVPVKWIMYLGEHRKTCGRCMKAIEKYKMELEKIYKQRKPDIIGLDD